MTCCTVLVSFSPVTTKWNYTLQNAYLCNASNIYKTLMVIELTPVPYIHVEGLSFTECQ